MENCSPQILKEVLKRGRAYRCLLCDKMTGEKRYVKSHIYKYHIPLDAIPFYCSLCHFQTDEEEKLKEHTTIYKKHEEARQALQKMGRVPEPNEGYLHRNKDGIFIKEEIHYEKMDKEESRKIWYERIREEKEKKAASTLSRTAKSMKSTSTHLTSSSSSVTTSFSSSLPSLPATATLPQPSKIQRFPVLPTILNSSSTSASLQPFPLPEALREPEPTIPRPTLPEFHPPSSTMSTPTIPDLLEIQDPVQFFTFLNEDLNLNATTPIDAPQPEIEGSVLPEMPSLSNNSVMTTTATAVTSVRVVPAATTIPSEKVVTPVPVLPAATPIPVDVVTSVPVVPAATTTPVGKVVTPLAVGPAATTSTIPVASAVPKHVSTTSQVPLPTISSTLPVTIPSVPSGSPCQNKDSERRRGKSPTRIMYDMVNHMFYMQSILQNIHHEMKAQTDLLRAIREENTRQRPRPFTTVQRQTATYNTNPRKRSRSPDDRNFNSRRHRRQ